jgi:hypothetical protein
MGFLMNKKIMGDVLSLIKGQNIDDVSLNGVTPSELFGLLENQGYSNEPIESNGWEHDFSVIFRKQGNPSLCYSGSWFGGYSAISIIEECEDTTERESDDDMVRRITGFSSMQAMMDVSDQTKRDIVELYESICGKSKAK